MSDLQNKITPLKEWQSTSNSSKAPTDPRTHGWSDPQTGDHTSTQRNAWWRYGFKLIPAKRNTQERPWCPSWSHFGALSGLFSLCVVIGSLVASVGVLFGSNNEPVDRWPTPPSTFIALFTALGNLGVRYALAQGVLITWWRRACHTPGTTLSKLQTDWRAGAGLRGALSAGRDMGIVGVACIFSTVILIDGPLLQRASTVASMHMPSSQPLSIKMAPELPHGWSGGWSTTELLGIDNTHPNPAFNSTIPTAGGSSRNDITTGGYHPHAQMLWEATLPLKGVVEGCKGECRATIAAPALFPVACKTQRVPVHPKTRYNNTEVYNQINGPPLEAEIFMITANLLIHGRDNEAIDLITGFSNIDANCTGEFVYNVCTLESGIGEYDILVQNDLLTMENIKIPRFKTFANNTAIDRGEHRLSTLAAIVNYMRLKWEAYTALYFNPADDTIGTIGDIGVESFITGGSNPVCASYRDPYDDMIREMNRLMIYLGAGAAREPASYLAKRLDPGLSTEAEVVGRTMTKTSVYRTRYWPIIIAAATNLVCLVLITPLYWRWWTLGRSVSFSPLEIAKAFKSPVLADYYSNSDADELGTATRQVSIRYGIEQSGPNGKVEFAFGNPAVVREPPKSRRTPV